jgi:hypothetical protein
MDDSIAMDRGHLSRRGRFTAPAFRLRPEVGALTVGVETETVCASIRSSPDASRETSGGDA